MADIAAVSERYDLAPDLAIVEVTERLFMDELGAAPPLRDMGCEDAQGLLWSRPIRASYRCSTLVVATLADGGTGNPLV